MRPTLDLLLERDGWTCGICHKPIESRDEASVDHIIPRYHKGPDTLWNTRAAHFNPCNRDKAAKLPHPREVRWDRITENEAKEARHLIHRALAWKYPLTAYPPGTLEFLMGQSSTPVPVGQAL